MQPLGSWFTGFQFVDEISMTSVPEGQGIPVHYSILLWLPELKIEQCVMYSAAHSVDVRAFCRNNSLWLRT